MNKPVKKLPITFNVVIFYELLTGFVEFVIGAGLMVLGEELQDLYFNFRDAGLLDNPHNVMIGMVQKYAPYLLDHHFFIGFYLAAVGILKLISAGGLMYKKRWADKMLVILLLLFLPLDVLGLFNHPSITRIIFVFTNVAIVIYLSRKEIVEYF